MVSIRDLEHIPRPGSRRDDRDAFQELCNHVGIEWPADVIDQTIWGLGQGSHLLDTLEHLDLSCIGFELRSYQASELLIASVHESCEGRVRQVAGEPDEVLRRYIPGHGEDVWTDTWREPPIFLDGSLLKPSQENLHLLEGHTRMGMLIGNIRLGRLEPTSTHNVFVGFGFTNLVVEIGATRPRRRAEVPSQFGTTPSNAPLTGSLRLPPNIWWSDDHSPPLNIANSFDRCFAYEQILSCGTASDVEELVHPRQLVCDWNHLSLTGDVAELWESWFAEQNEAESPNS